MSKPTVFITGAAAGIGRATALRFAREGYVVGCYDVDETNLRTLREEILKAGGSAYAGRLDVGDPEQWAGALADFWEKYGRLDVLINNAGVLSSGKFAAMDVAAHRRMIDINFGGTVFGSRAAYPYLRETKDSVLINLCSASAIYGQPDLATYGATKSAVKGLTEALDIEWAADGIRVAAVWPLFVQTGMVDGLDTGSTRSLGVRLRADDVANSIWDVVRKRPLLPTVHYEVGLQAKALAILAKYVPGWAMRTVNRFVNQQ